MLDAVIDTMLELSPWLLVGMAVAGLLHGILPKDFILKQLRGRLGVLKAVALGVPLPLCSCGVIPAGLGLKRDGASNGASVGFLISTPQTGVDSILVSASFLGLPFAIFKVLSAAVTGILGGILVEGLESRSDTPSAPRVNIPSSAHPQSLTARLREVVAHSLLLLDSIWRWIVIGVLISAAITVFLPAEGLEAFRELGSVGAGLTMLVVSLPLYVCATASVPIAAALVAGGMPAGAALVFLMAGPATNVATIGAVYRGFGTRTLIIYLTTIVVGSLGFGVLFDFVLDPAQTSVIRTHHETTPWAIAGTLLLSALLVHFAVRDTLHWIRDRLQTRDLSAIEISVDGIQCGRCVKTIESALLSLPGVDSAVVRRDPDRALVSGSANRNQIEEAIRGAGYAIG